MFDHLPKQEAKPEDPMVFYIQPRYSSMDSSSEALFGPSDNESVDPTNIMAFSIERAHLNMDDYMSEGECRSVIDDAIKALPETELKKFDDVEQNECAVRALCHVIGKRCRRGMGKYFPEHSTVAFIGRDPFDAGIIISECNGMFFPYFQDNWKNYFINVRP